MNEGDVSRYLVKPLLERAANAMPTTPFVGGGNCLEYCSGLDAETQSQSPSSSGVGPKVDFTMMGFNGKDAVYIIPVEVKTAMVEKDMAQIARYMSTMGNGPHIKDLSMVGMLIDEKKIRFAFSLFSSNATIPLPLVLITKEFEWRHESSLSNLLRHGEPKSMSKRPCFCMSNLFTSCLSRPRARDPRRIWEHWRGAKLLLRGFELQ